MVLHIVRSGACLAALLAAAACLQGCSSGSSGSGTTSTTTSFPPVPSNADLAALQSFFASPNGLGMSGVDAYNLGVKEAGYLMNCSIAVSALQALRDALYRDLSMTMADVRTNILPLAYQHASPDDLSTLFNVLYGSGSLNLPLSDARSNAMGLAQKHVVPSLLAPLFQVLYGASGVSLPLSQARQKAIDLTAAGVDAATLQALYQSYARSMPKDAALEAATRDAVAVSLNGTAARYADDGKLYAPKVFQSYYGTQWLTQWLAGVPEERTSADGLNYTAAEFQQFFGASWLARWNAAPVAVHRRISGDGKTYTLDEFVRFYSTKWQAEWSKSYEIVDVCAGFGRDQATCGAQRSCLWKPTGDPTSSSCVARPLQVSKELIV